jgi:hypothetical protein
VHILTIPIRVYGGSTADARGTLTQAEGVLQAVMERETKYKEEQFTNYKPIYKKYYRKNFG